jgi:putative peptidoglycan lipid II flippase
MQEETNVVKAAGKVGFYTFISRILGFLRDMVMAFYFGSGMISDAFIAAFRLPNMFRKLLAEGSLTLAFVPVFTDYLENDGKEEAFRLAESAMATLTLLLVFLSVVGIICASGLLTLIAPGFAENPEKMQLAVLLTRILLPYMIFICLTALSMGILNAMGHFTAPALAPIILNVAMISSMWAGARVTQDVKVRVALLACGVILGGVLQLGIQIPSLRSYGFQFRRLNHLIHSGLGRIGRMMIPSVIGAGVYQVNVFVGTILASLLMEGSITWLYYADRIFQFPLGIFAISMGTAVLPSLSRQAVSGNIEGLKKTFNESLRLVVFITFPAMVGLMVLGEPIVSVLFKRGEFGVQDLNMTSQALFFYTVGLFPVSAVRVTAPVFYARQDADSPMKCAAVSIIVNLVLSVLLMRILKHGGLALAASLASFVNFAMLIVILRYQLGALGGMKIFASCLRSVFCSIIMGLVVHGLALYLIRAYNVPTFKMITGMTLCISTGVAVYLVLSFLMKSSELKTIFSIFAKR